MLLDDAVGGGEAEAGAFALFFGGEERLEDFIDNFRRHAAAGIGDGQADVFPGHGLEAAGVLSGDDFVVSADGDGSFAGAGLHGVSGIDAQVHDDLFEFADVGVGGPEGGIEVQFDGELGAEAALDERVELAQSGVEVAVGEFDVAPAGESEQSFDELGRSFGGGAGVVDVVAGVFESRGGEVAIGERQVSEDTGEQIVKVVGDATGEAADGLHFLGLFQAFLELLFVGQVAEYPELADAVAGFGDQGRGIDVEDAAFGAQHLPFRFGLGACGLGDGLVPALGDGLGVGEASEEVLLPLVEGAAGE